MHAHGRTGSRRFITTVLVGCLSLAGCATAPQPPNAGPASPQPEVVTLDTVCTVEGVDWLSPPLVAYMLEPESRVYWGRVSSQEIFEHQVAAGTDSENVQRLYSGRTTVTYDLACRGVTSPGGAQMWWTMDLDQKERLRYWDCGDCDITEELEALCEHQPGDTLKLGRYRHAGVPLLSTGTIRGELTMDTGSPVKGPVKAPQIVADEVKASGQMSIAVNKQVASTRGVASLQQFEEEVAQDPDESRLVPGIGELAYTETDTGYVATAALQDVFLGDLVGGGIWTELRTDDIDWYPSIAEDGTLELSAERESLDADPGQDTDFGGFDLTVHFPGTVTSFSGAGSTRVDRDTARWQFPLQPAIDIHATARV